MSEITCDECPNPGERFGLALLALLVLIPGCARHQAWPVRPEGPTHADLDLDLAFTVERDLVYVERPTVGPLHADLYRPLLPGRYPAVVTVHGGGWDSRSREDMVETCKRLAAAGFVALNISYRFAPEARHPDQVDDVRAAVRWLREHAAEHAVDAERIAGWGYSAGAHLVAQAAVAGEPSLQAAVLGGLPSDLTLAPDSEPVRQYLGVDYEEDAERWREASPLHHVDAGDPPCFLYHGLGDDTVYPLHSERFAAALRDSGVAVERYTVPLLGHALMFVFDGGAAEAAIGFLHLHLGGPDWSGP